MTLNDFFHSCKNKSSHLFREFVWILVEKFGADEAMLIAGSRKISENEQAALKDWVERKKQDYPLQYFIGTTEFLGHLLHVGDKVLIPRMETEEIASFVLDECRNKNVRSMIDIGAGSGCLGIGVALGIKSLESLELLEPFGDESLKKNVEDHCVGKSFNTKIYEIDFESYEFKNNFDLIVSNPPYIYFDDPDVAGGVYEHEPHEALFGGEKGWEKVVAWVEKSYPYLNDEGLLVFEMSHDQRKIIEEKLGQFNPVVHRDSFGKDRFFVIRKN